MIIETSLNSWIKSKASSQQLDALTTTANNFYQLCNRQVAKQEREIGVRDLEVHMNQVTEYQAAQA